MNDLKPSAPLLFRARLLYAGLALAALGCLAGGAVAAGLPVPLPVVRPLLPVAPASVPLPRKRPASDDTVTSSGAETDEAAATVPDADGVPVPAASDDIAAEGDGAADAKATSETNGDDLETAAQAGTGSGEVAASDDGPTEEAETTEAQADSAEADMEAPEAAEAEVEAVGEQVEPAAAEIAETDAEAAGTEGEPELAATQNPATAPDAAAGTAHPKPRSRPTGAALAAAAAAHVPPGPPYGFRGAPQLATALKAVESDHYDEALRIRRRLHDPIEGRIIDWLVAAAPNSGMSAEAILAVRARNVGWPEPEELRLRAEQAFLRAPHSDEEFAAFFADERPLTLTGRTAAVRIAVREGRTVDAARGARNIWRAERMPQSMASRFAEEFEELLRPEDHLTRLHLLVYDRQQGDARRQAARMGAGYADYAVTMIAALGRKTLTVKNLEAVPPELRDDPIYRLAQVRALRQADRQVAAAQILFHVRPAAEAETDPDRWWDERRDLSRELLDRGFPELAYRVVAGHNARSEADRVEAEFHAGWYALRFLNKPHQAKAHFQRVAGLATIPQTTSRAHYWLGRAHGATGHTQAARLSHSIAARYASTFYGQLSGELIGLDGTHLAATPAITVRDRLAFAANDIAEAIRRLSAAGYGHRTWPFFEALSESLQTPGEFALAAILARRIEQPRSLLQITAVAGKRGIDIGALNAPLIGIPKSVPVPDTIDRAMVYAVSRQESAFHAGAVSHAGARGLMQLMTATARATARSIGISFSADRLTRDPLYNATLGAAHLGELITNLSGSYVMTFAGYNAGPGRAVRWARAYGDPRNTATDAVDWIERIPFDETRDYVQKVMANLQVYRARLGLPTSPLGDLSRGTPRS